MLNQLSVAELMNSYRDSLKILQVLRSLRNKRIGEIDYTFSIDELIETFLITHKLTSDNVSLYVTKSKYRKNGTSWTLYFTRRTNPFNGFSAPKRFVVDISHMPLDFNIGSRISITINTKNLADHAKKEFFDRFDVERNPYMHELAKFKFEDPYEIMNFLIFLEDKMIFN